MSNYELVYFSGSLTRKRQDEWERKIENIDGEIVEPILKDGYTRGFVVDTSRNLNR